MAQRLLEVLGVFPYREWHEKSQQEETPGRGMVDHGNCRPRWLVNIGGGTNTDKHREELGLIRKS